MSVGGLAQPERFSQRVRILTVVALVAAIGLVLAGPLSQLAAQRARVAELKTQEAQLNEAINELEAAIQTLNTDREIERIARADLGMARPNERVFPPIPGGADGGEALVSPRDAPGRAGPGLLSRWWDALVDAAKLPR